MFWHLLVCLFLLCFHSNVVLANPCAGLAALIFLLALITCTLSFHVVYLHANISKQLMLIFELGVVNLHPVVGVVFLVECMIVFQLYGSKHDCCPFTHNDLYVILA